MRIVKSSIVLFVVFLLLVSCKEGIDKGQKEKQKHPRLTYEEYKDTEWYSYYKRNLLDSAQESMEKHLMQFPDELPTLAMYAELLKRQKEYERADVVAGKVIALDSSDGDAWMVKGDIRNPQYGKNAIQDSSGKDFDYYYFEGLKRDSTNGNIWEVAIFSCLKKGDITEYYRGLKLLYGHGQYTPRALAIARLYLKQLPANAILVTAGDMDTYPLLAVQAGEDLRKDVTILNYSLLNLHWYIKAMCELGGVSLPLSEDALNSLEVVLTPGEKYRYKTIAKQFLDSLALFDGREKPLCLVANINPDANEGHYRIIKGHYSEVVKTVPQSRYDLEAMAATRQYIDVSDMKGPFVSIKENSPLLLNLNARKVTHASTLWPYLVVASEKFRKNDSTAWEMDTWIADYCKSVGDSETYKRLEVVKRDFNTQKSSGSDQ